MSEVYEITRKALSELYDVERSGGDLNKTPYLVMEIWARFGNAGCDKYRKPWVKRYCKDLAEAEKCVDSLEEENLYYVGNYCTCACDYEIWHVVEEEGVQADIKPEPADEQEQVEKSAAGSTVLFIGYTNFKRLGLGVCPYFYGDYCELGCDCDGAEVPKVFVIQMITRSGDFLNKWSVFSDLEQAQSNLARDINSPAYRGCQFRIVSVSYCGVAEAVTDWSRCHA